jgi:hypothetical protein
MNPSDPGTFSRNRSLDKAFKNKCLQGLKKCLLVPCQIELKNNQTTIIVNITAKQNNKAQIKRCQDITMLQRRPKHQQ